MLERRFKGHPMRLVALGMLCVSVGAVSLRYHIPGLPARGADVLSGACYGVGLAMMVVGMLRRGRAGRPRD